MFTFGQATSKALQEVMTSFNFYTKNKFINERIKYFQDNLSFIDLYIVKILDDSKSIFLKNILDKFIDRYHSKVLNSKNPKAPEILDDYENKGRCELVIAQNFKKLFEYPILTLYKDSYEADILSQFLFANLLSLFFFKHKVSFTNHYDNFNLINFDINNDLGIIIQIESHYCCLYICDGRQKFYNDNNKIVYDCEWINLLKTTNTLYVEKDKNFSFINYDSHPNKQNLKKVFYLTVISKHTRDSDLDKEIKDILKNNYSSIKERELQFLLGFKFSNGSGVAEDKAEAVRWYRLAAAQGHVGAQYYLGLMFQEGQGVAQDDAEAVRWLRLSAEQGDANAQFSLGWMFYHGEGVAQDDAEAVRWLRLSAEQGDADAQFSLGRMFYHGEGVAEDKAEAVRWLRLSAEQGDADAQYNLGWMFANGSGVAQDKAEAVRWYHLAAAQGYAAAQNNLGWMFYHGDGVAQDKAEAVRLYRLAAAQGNVDARTNLDKI
jgi:TPR repeat protein